MANLVVSVSHVISNFVIIRDAVDYENYEYNNILEDSMFLISRRVLRGIHSFQVF